MGQKRNEKRRKESMWKELRQSRQRHKDHFRHIELLKQQKLTTHLADIFLFYANPSVQYSIIWIDVKSVHACIMPSKMNNVLCVYEIQVQSWFVYCCCYRCFTFYEIRLATGICLLSRIPPHVCVHFCSETRMTTIRSAAEQQQQWNEWYRRKGEKKRNGKISEKAAFIRFVINLRLCLSANETWSHKPCLDFRTYCVWFLNNLEWNSKWNNGSKQR